MSKRPGPLFACLLIFGGLAMLAFGLYEEGYALQIHDRGKRVEGTVVGISAANGNRSVGRETMTTQFTTPAGKISYIRSDISSATHHLGERMPLLFDPETGATVVDSFFDVYGSLLWFGITGAVLVSVGAISLLGAPRTRP